MLRETKNKKTTASAFDWQYHAAVKETLLSRYKIMLPISLAFVLGYHWLDIVLYPPQASLFLAIRIVACSLICILSLFFYSQAGERYIPFTLDVLAGIVVSSFSLMIYLSNGSNSSYFAGINIVMLCLAAINSFYYRHNLWACVVFWAIYNAAVLFSPSVFTIAHFIEGNLFVIGTATFIVFMTRFSGQQYYTAFLRAEELKEKERQLTALYRRIEQKPCTAELASLKDKEYFITMLSERIRTSAERKTSFMLVLADIDRFGEINNALGGHGGDEVLVEIVKTLRDNLRPTDLLGRYGADEFMILFDGADETVLKKRLDAVNEKIKEACSLLIKPPQAASLTFGAAHYRHYQSVDAQEFFNRAEQQLLLGKKEQSGTLRVENLH